MSKRIEAKVCDAGHAIQRKRNGKWPGGCKVCGAARQAAWNEEQHQARLARLASYTPLPSGRPRLPGKTCPSGHEIGRSASGKWRRGCVICADVARAAFHARRRVEAEERAKDPQVIAMRERARLASLERRRARMDTDEGRRYGREQKMNRRATVPGQLVLARTQLKSTIKWQDQRIAEIEAQLGLTPPQHRSTMDAYAGPPAQSRKETA